MSLIDTLMIKFMENRSYKMGKSLARTFLVSSLAMQEHYKEEARTYAWIARKALETRPSWIKIDEDAFVHQPSKTLINIKILIQ